MAKTARLDVEIHALEALAARFESLAKRRGGNVDLVPLENGMASLTTLPDCPDRPGGRAESPLFERNKQYPPCPKVPAVPALAEAWQIACRQVSQRYVSPETMHHTVVISECYSLACMLIAYGLVASRTPPLPLSEKQHAPAFNANGHRVIVVDDVADVLVNVGAFLVNAGFAVRKAANGDEALQIIAGEPSIDILVTDFAMPGLNGAELIRQATELRPSLKAVVITGYPNADGLGDAPVGTTVLTKPFRRDALVAAVRSLFRDEIKQDQVPKLPETVSV